MQKPVDTSVFQDALASLNAKQRQAVETIEGPVMVIAGPGTGKTQVLTLRIANILLQTDAQPENILALTFTDSGARAMRERLRRYLGPVAYRVPIYTFHSFADRLIKNYPDAFSRIIGGRAIADVEKVALLETILEDPTLTLLRPLGNHTYYVPYLISMIGHLKQEYVTPDRLMDIIATQEEVLAKTGQFHTKGAHKGKVRGDYSRLEKDIAKNRELVQVYRRYEAALRAEQWYDFDDMLSETVVTLGANEDMLRDLQETYHYILADEHQDVNGVQNKILELLANFHATPNIFVVGDEKQAIYRFQGASLENFLHFVDVFPATVQISLTENYRSGPEVLAFAQALITVPDEDIMKLRIPLSAAAVPQAEVIRLEFSHQAIENDWIITTVKDEIKNGVSPEQVAVIVRTNREVEFVAEQLRQAGIPVTASAEGDVLVHPVTQALEALINFVLTDTDEVALFTVLHGAYWGISTDDLVRIMSARSSQRSLASILSNKDTLIEVGVRNTEAALGVMRVLSEARAREVYDAPHRVLQYVLEASGFLTHLMKYDPYEGTRVVRRVYDEIEAMVIRDGVGTLREVQKIIALRRRYGLPLLAPFITTHAKAVAVMTAHKSKGLEYDVVFIPYLNDANWGGRTKRTMFTVPIARYLTEEVDDAVDDERRLLYVACTRAKYKLYLSSAAASSLGKAMSQSRLIADLNTETLRMVDTTALEESFSPLMALTPTNEAVLTPETLITLLKERGISATSLNTLLKNPWDFFYRTLLRIPQVQELHLQFGTAIHAVLEQVTSLYGREGRWATATEIKGFLEATLLRLPITTREYTRLHEKGFSMLCNYVAHLESTRTAVSTREEVSLRVTLETGLPELSELTLTGKIDRVDFAEDEKAVRVVDYKTGKPKSRAAISGATASSDGGYRRQLIFYALLLSLCGDERYKSVREGVLSFVEPASNGVIREETFIVTDEEIEALKIELVSAIQGFISGEFLTDQRCAEASEYKDLACSFMQRIV